MRNFNLCNTLILSVWILMCALVVCASDKNVDWWVAQRDVNAALAQSGASISALAKQVCQSAPADGQAAMFKLYVLMLAGMSKESIQTLHELKQLSPELGNQNILNIYSEACYRLHAWDVAEAVVTIFADNISGISFDGHDSILDHFLSSGWTVERVDMWLASKPKGIKNFWIKARLHFDMQHGIGDALEEELADRVRSSPQDVAGAIIFLDTITYAHSGARRKVPDLSWVAEIIKPVLATDANELAAKFEYLKIWKNADIFYRQAITIPLTDEEVELFGRGQQVFRSASVLRADFAVSTREGLVRCLMAMKQTEEAQKWMQEAAAIREKSHLRQNTYLAGQVQEVSSARVIEKKIVAEEKTSGDNPDYWKERALYYQGRKEPVNEEAAIRKGLALTSPQPESARRGKGYTDWRSNLLSYYVHFLTREKRDIEAVALLRKEIAESPADSESSARAAYLLASDFSKQLSADDAVLWNWLEKRTTWKFAEERLLREMLKNAKQDELDGYLIRAEKLASGNDPTRAYMLGWIENSLGFSQRSIPLIEYAAEHTQDKNLKEQAAASLFRSYMGMKDWRSADRVFTNSTGRLTPDEYSKVAVLAAKAGNKADAMRIWSRVADMDPSEMRELEQLLKAGLRDELFAFYQNMQKSMPSSDIPAKALKAFFNYDCKNAEELLHLKLYARSLKEIDKALSLAVDDDEKFRVLRCKYFIARGSKNYSEAIKIALEILNREHATDQQKMEWLCALVGACTQAGKLDDALAECDKYVTSANPILKSIAYQSKYDLFLKKKHFEAALKVTDDVLRQENLTDEQKNKWLENRFKIYFVMGGDGDVKAQYELGNCYRDGRGVAKDKATVEKWYRKASEQGLPEAKAALEKLNNGGAVD